MSKKNNFEIRELVRKQYEQYPYPLRENDFDMPVREGLISGCPHHFFHWFWPCVEQTQDIDILVAGCGTSEAAKVAAHVPEARITAIDITQRSLDITERLLSHNNIINVDLRNLAIEDVHQLGREFDLIYCTGVLHHLPDPNLGLSALRSVLKNNGSMLLMLYGKFGRDAIYIMQEFFRRVGLSTNSISKQDIATIRDLLKTMPSSHPINHRMEMFNNLNVSDIEIVDLFLHPQDRAYSIPDIYAYLEANGLVLQKMINRAHYAPSCTELIKSPIYSKILALSEKDQLTIGELYRSAAIMHNFIACPAERPKETWDIRIDSENIDKLIPVKNFMVQSNRTKLPDGDVIRLSLQGHKYKDIFMHLDSIQLAVTEFIDGNTTLKDIHVNSVMRTGMAISEKQLLDYVSLLYDHDYIWFRKLLA